MTPTTFWRSSHNTNKLNNPPSYLIVETTRSGSHLHDTGGSLLVVRNVKTNRSGMKAIVCWSFVDIDDGQDPTFANAIDSINHSVKTVEIYLEHFVVLPNVRPGTARLERALSFIAQRSSQPLILNEFES